MLALKDRVKELTTTTGTGTLTLVSAPTGYRRFSAVLSNADTTYYCIESGSQWEVGVGTYSANTLARTTVLASSNSNSLIDIVAARSFVFVTYAADKAVYKDGSERAVMGAGGLIFSDASVQTTAATSPDLSPYLTISSAASTYLTQSSATTLLAAKADLVGGLIPSAQLPSYVDDVVEAANLAAFPGTGETGKIYVAIDTGYTYRWSGSVYVRINEVDLSSYLTSSTAASTYLPLAGGTLTGDLKFTDALYDIGKSGATRPRDGFFSRNVTVGGVLTLSTSGLNIPTTTSGPAKLTVFGNDLYYDPGGHTAGGHIFRTTSSTATLLTLYLTGATFGVPVIASIVSPASHVLEQRNSTNAQTFRVAGTWTSSTSYEYINIKGKSSANFEIGPENGSAGGTLRGLTIGGYPAGTATIVGWAQFRPNASTGALEAFYLGPIADSTVTGGNARGTNSVDLQLVRSTAAQVASGIRSVTIGNSNTASAADSVAIGSSNTASSTSNSTGSIAIGASCTASSWSSVAIGYNCSSSGFASSSFGDSCSATGDRGSFAAGRQSLAHRTSMFAFASSCFSTAGDAQKFTLVGKIKTTNNSPTSITWGTFDPRFTIPSGKMLFVDILISGIKSDGSASACYKRKVSVKNVGGTTSLVGTVETVGTDIEDSAACDVAITADNTNDALDISVTGIAAETWRWVAVVEGLEIAYGT